MRRQQLTEAQITALLDPPTDQRELVRHYTLYYRLRTSQRSGAVVAMIIASATSGLIVLALDTPKIAASLNRPLPQWLGRISYSLYLIHMPILLALGHLMLKNHVPFGLFVLAVIITSLGAATLMQIFVEAPATLGQRVARAGGLKTTAPPSAVPDHPDETKAA